MTLARSSFPAAGVRGLGGRFSSMSRPRRWAAFASVGWAVVVVTYALGFLGVAAGAATRGMLFLDAMFLLMVLALPMILIWLAAWLAEELARQREIITALAELTVPLIGGARRDPRCARSAPPVSPEAISTAVQAAVLDNRAPDPTSQLDRLLAGQARLEVALQKLGFRAGKIDPDPSLCRARPARVDPTGRRRPGAGRRAGPPAPGRAGAAGDAKLGRPGPGARLSARCRRRRGLSGAARWRSATTGWRRCSRPRRTCWISSRRRASSSTNCRWSQSIRRRGAASSPANRGAKVTARGRYSR